MYTPKHFQITDQQEAVDFIRRYSFGMLVSVEDGIPVATHIPFTVRETDGQLILSSHIALANSQGHVLTDSKALVVFTEPHAYISPKHYEREQNVPTWNYIAIHAYGDVHLIDSDEGKLASLEEMIGTYDTDYFAQWERLPLDWKLKMIKGIVAFEMVVTDLQGKKKLSQNRSETERTNIINSFTSSADQQERNIAAYMQAHQ